MHHAVVFQEDKKPADSDRVSYELLLCECWATELPKQMEVRVGRGQEESTVHIHLFL